MYECGLAFQVGRSVEECRGKGCDDSSINAKASRVVGPTMEIQNAKVGVMWMAMTLLCAVSQLRICFRVGLSLSLAIAHTHTLTFTSAHQTWTSVRPTMTIGTANVHAPTRRVVAPVTTIKDTDVVVEGEKKVTAWPKELPVERYANAFVEAGYEDLSYIAEMSLDDAMEIEGMKKPHAKRICKASRNLTT